MTEEEIEEVASKEWREQQRDLSHVKEPGKKKRMKNLTGPKTEEGKKRALENLRPAAPNNRPLPRTHGGYVMDVLNHQEQEFYDLRKEQYMNDFDLNESSDAALLHSVLIEEVIMRRLLLYQSERPSASIDKPLSECQRRLREALKSLGMTREQRQGLKINVQHSIADLAAQVLDEADIDERTLKKLKIEEEELLRRKQKSGNAAAQDVIIDAEYTMVDDEEEVSEDG